MTKSRDLKDYSEEELLEALKSLEEIKKDEDPHEKLKEYYRVHYKEDSIPEPCRACPNHPSNGGSGICYCTLGNQFEVTY